MLFYSCNYLTLSFCQLEALFPPNGSPLSADYPPLLRKEGLGVVDFNVGLGGGSGGSPCNTPQNP